tara:strand:+ start:21725 stop:22165 length:441 start_codon:yes stop_codon:yes gene_type:complete
VVNKIRKRMSHINFKVTGTNTIEGGYDDLRHFKREHLCDTPAYVDDTGILEKFEDKLTDSIITCNEYFISADNASYHKLEIDTASDELIDELKSTIDATSSWNILNVSYISDAEFDASNSGQELMACCGNCASGTELVALTLACRQ